MSALFGIYGAGGCGRGIMPLAREQLKKQGVLQDRLVYVDDNPHIEVVNGQRVVAYSEFLAIPAKERYLAAAIANSEIRQNLVQRFQNDEVQPWEVTASNVVIMDAVRIGEGALLSPFVTLASNVQIGKFFQANIYSYVEHDCVIGDFVTFAPSVKCNGNVLIKDYAYIGAGAVIKQGTLSRPLVIGKRAIVGMGAVVTKDVPDGATVIGNPAKILRKG